VSRASIPNLSPVIANPVSDDEWLDRAFGPATDGEPDASSGRAGGMDERPAGATTPGRDVPPSSPAPAAPAATPPQTPAAASQPVTPPTAPPDPAAALRALGVPEADIAALVSKYAPASASAQAPAAESGQQSKPLAPEVRAAIDAANAAAAERLEAFRQQVRIEAQVDAADAQLRVQYGNRAPDPSRLREQLDTLGRERPGQFASASAMVAEAYRALAGDPPSGSRSVPAAPSWAPPQGSSRPTTSPEDAALDILLAGGKREDARRAALSALR
jgi:hypothetical protein